MDKKQSIEEHYRRLTKLIELSEAIVKDSQLITEQERSDYLGDYQTNRVEAKQSLENKDSRFMKQLEKEVLTPWNETYDEDSQRFWKLVKQSGLELEREDHLEKILKRGRIANFTEYNVVQDSIVIWQQEGQVTSEQAAELHKMLGEYEQKKSI